MREKSDRPETGERHVRDIRRATHRKWSSEEKIRIVLSGLRGAVEMLIVGGAAVTGVFFIGRWVEELTAG